jgi:hypothetical protein
LLVRDHRFGFSPRDQNTHIAAATPRHHHHAVTAAVGTGMVGAFVLPTRCSALPVKRQSRPETARESGKEGRSPTGMRVHTDMQPRRRLARGQTVHTARACVEDAPLAGHHLCLVFEQTTVVPPDPGERPSDQAKGKPMSTQPSR